MKEKDVWLTPKEIHLMLQGSLQWADIQFQTTSLKTEMRKLRESAIDKAERPRPSKPKETNPPVKNERSTEKLEGKPVVLLLGSVGLLTLSSWFYFLLSTK